LDNLIKISNLTISFSSDTGMVKAVNDISFSVRKGEIVGIAGESGSGKSLTALSLMKLIPNSASISSKEMVIYPDSPQRIDLKNIPVGQMSGVRGKLMGMIFQEPMTSLNPVMTCGEQVEEVLKLHLDLSKKDEKGEVLNLFEKVRLSDPDRIYHSYPHQLSGGQKQRVMIAIATCVKPDLLIADEPTTALDASVQASVIGLIKDLQKETGMSVIFISHDLQVLQELADRIIVMFRGEIIERGTTKEIFNHPKHPYTKALTASRPPLDRRFSRLPEISDFMSIEEGENGENYNIIEKEIDTDLFLKNLQISQDLLNEKSNFYSQQKSLLEVKGLTVKFPKTISFLGRTKDYLVAVNKASLHVKKGETLGLIGQSGSGKTTLGRAIMHLQDYSAGEIIFNGINLSTASTDTIKSVRKEMQIIFQDPYASLNPRKPIGETILEPMRLYNLNGNSKSQKEKAIDLLKTVGIPSNSFHRLPHEFSGGQRQRICIARALAVEPSFIVCDESVSALDVSVQAQILNLLMDLKKRFGLTYIFISHDPAVIRFVSDRVLEMRQGNLYEV
jgi:peptide/nickel transport system ATP-binding protein